MQKARLLIFFICFHLIHECRSQNIGGTVNSYAAVSSIGGSTIGVSTGTAFSAGDKLLLIQMKGAVVTTSNNSSFGTITSMGGAGTYEFLNVSSVSGTVITTTSAPTNTYATTGYVQVVRVPKYCQAFVTSSITCPAWSSVSGTGGIIAIEAGTLALSADINANGKGFRGGVFATSNFCCSNGNFAGAAGGSGGEKGESVSAWITNQNGLKGRQANGGGAGNCDNSGGGGGGNTGSGGIGGNQYSGCGTFDDRGIGGANLLVAFSTLFMGGGGGGGFRDNGQSCTNGGNGGGIIYIQANAIIPNNHFIMANGDNVSTIINDEGAGGGGAGGTIFIECPAIVGNMTVSVNGGYGGSNLNSIFASDCHGPGGGGGGGFFACSGSSMPIGVTFSGNGGAAGTVNNSSSSCYNTTFGAGPGTNGFSAANLPSSLLPYPMPTITVAQSNTICAGQSATLTASGASSYTWISGPTTSVYPVSPLATTVYTVIGVNGNCSASLLHTVQVSTGPTLSVNGPTAICSGQSVTLTASGAATFSWSNGPTTNSIVVSPQLTTVYTLTGSTTGCTNTASKQLSVTITPTLTISGITQMCTGQTVALTAASANNYTWNTGANTPIINVSPLSTTNYSVFGANGSCTASAFKTINVTTTPTLTVAGTNSICSGNSATITVSGANSYAWNTGSGATSIVVSPLSTTVYSVTGSNSNCSSTEQFTVIVVQTPVMSISGSTVMCTGQTLQITAAPANSHTWNTGSNNSALLISPPTLTTYSVIGANSNCTGTAAITVSVNITPTVGIIPSATAICAGDSVKFDAFGANSYFWTNGATTYSTKVSPFATSTYTVYGTTGSCTGNSTVNIVVIPLPALSSGNYSLCVGVSQATLVANGASSYVWSPSTGLNTTTGATVIASPQVSTTYTVTGYNSFCVSSITVGVQTFSSPIVSVQSSTNFVCVGETVTMTASGASAYAWQPTLTILHQTPNGVVALPISTAIYTVFGYGTNNCVNTATQLIIVAKTPVTYVSGEAGSICAGEQVQLIATGAESYVWVPGIGLSSTTRDSVVAAPQTSQTYTVTGSNGQFPYLCSSTATLMLDVKPYSNIYIAGPDSVCYGDRVQLTVHGAKSFTWVPNKFLNNYFVSTPVLTPTAPLVYTVTGIGSGSCAGTNTFGFAIKPLPYVNAGRDTSINFDEQTVLHGDGNGWEYLWLGRDHSFIECTTCSVTLVKPVANTCYILEVKNSGGCVSRDEVCVEVRRDYAIFIPSCFSPNDDGLNDVFKPLGFGVIEYKLQIFNRWGQQLYEGTGSFTEENYAFWDGTFNGKKSPLGSYVYKFIYTLSGSKVQTKEGSVTLINRENPEPE